MIRLGLCCKFAREPIRFRSTTAAWALGRPREEYLQRIADLAIHNAKMLQKAIEFCSDRGIGSFRVSSDLLPLINHPEAGYQTEELPKADEIVSEFKKAGEKANLLGIRRTFHPGQFTVLNSPRKIVRQNAVADLRYHAEIASWIGADVINIHVGGGYGNKSNALERFRKTINRLPEEIRRWVTLENDDRVFSPADIMEMCRLENIPMVYDVHHHRCRPDGLTVEEATERALETWDREPVFHISSPRDGWQGKRPTRHHDFLSTADFPAAWRKIDITLEVEAKAKELAVLKLQKWLREEGI